MTALPSVTTFDDDVAFLGAHDQPTTLESPSGGRIAVSAKFQGRVMTSAVEPGGRSLGFVNRPFITQRTTGTAFDNYGGEDRFWLGPEAGQYGLYFPAGKPFTFANWQTPRSLQEGAWEVEGSDRASVTFGRSMSFTNYAGTRFEVGVRRRVSLLSQKEVADHLGVAVPAGVKWVAFATTNTIRNAGTAPWTESHGLISVWISGMFAPLPGTKVIVPFVKNAAGPVVNDGYFGKVPAERLTVDQQAGVILFTCDGHHRSKIGLSPARAKPAIGSYAAEANVLTLVLYSKPAAATKYVNSMWEQQKDPYAGDVVNSYNDGPTEPGKPSLGGFYEIETSSPAAALGPGVELTHVHQTFHFVGPGDALDVLARKVLGVGVTRLGRDL